jgi:hypothetical protein
MLSPPGSLTAGTFGLGGAELCVTGATGTAGAEVLGSWTDGGDGAWCAVTGTAAAPGWSPAGELTACIATGASAGMGVAVP